MKNAGWMGWAASFRGPASIGCAEMLAGLIFLAGLTNQPAFCFKKCWLNSKSCWNLASASIWKCKMLAGCPIEGSAGKFHPTEGGDGNFHPTAGKILRFTKHFCWQPKIWGESCDSPSIFAGSPKWLGGKFSWASQHWLCWNAGWIDFLGWARKPASILFQKMLDEFEIMVESGASKHVKMKNAGWMCWVASFEWAN